RVVKTAVHELGHTLGLGHHGANPQCVMFFSEKLADTDRKSRDFCRACADSAKPTLSRLRTGSGPRSRSGLRNAVAAPSPRTGGLAQIPPEAGGRRSRDTGVVPGRVAPPSCAL